jgi:hypothetical protein
LAPKIVDDGIEAWFAPSSVFLDPSHSDFWRASRRGQLFLIRGYEEDGENRVPPGQGLDITIPIWRVGECVLHSARFAAAVDAPDATVYIQVSWSGLVGRRLNTMYSRRLPPSTDATASQDTAVGEATYRADAVRESLVDIVVDLTRPLFELFAFYELPRKVVEEELDNLQKGV